MSKHSCGRHGALGCENWKRHKNKQVFHPRLATAKVYGVLTGEYNDTIPFFDFEGSDKFSTLFVVNVSKVM
jgi:hypothetical protein